MTSAPAGDEAADSSESAGADHTDGSWLLDRPPVDLHRWRRIGTVVFMVVMVLAIASWALAWEWTR